MYHRTNQSLSCVSASDEYKYFSLQQQQQQQPPVRPSRSRHHGSRRESSGTTSAGVIALPAGSRGPRSLYLRRDGDSFGFTLRHFIVYPPDSIA
ncbi:hypothetical protein CBL_00550, partial [Carabus blaptoides fortunei]